MSTEYKNIKNNRFLTLLQIGEVVFHSSDLANIWQIYNSNTLYTTIKRYSKQGLLHKLQKGLYSILPIEKLDPYLLGIKALHKYCYISAETVLENEGIIFQKSNYITIISSISKKFSLGGYQYYSRQLNDAFLFQDIGITKKNGVNIASAERAVADILYFNSKRHFDADSRIDWKKVKKIQKEIGYIKK